MELAEILAAVLRSWELVSLRNALVASFSIVVGLTFTYSGLRACSQADHLPRGIPHLLLGVGLVSLGNFFDRSWWWLNGFARSTENTVLVKFVVCWTPYGLWASAALVMFGSLLHVRLRLLECWPDKWPLVVSVYLLVVAVTSLSLTSL